MTNDKMTNAQRLSEWFMAEGRRRDWFAAKLNVNKSTVTRWTTGDTQPSLSHAIAVEKLTGGAVRAEDW